MKKIFALLAGIGLSMSAMAVDDQGNAMAAGTNSVAITDCSLLSEDVKINLSANVFGAYACNTLLNQIGVATCHPNGRKGTVSVSCDPATDAACDTDTDADGVADHKTVNNGLTYIASSAGGGVSGTEALNCVAGGDVTSEAATAAGL